MSEITNNIINSIQQTQTTEEHSIQPIDSSYIDFSRLKEGTKIGYLLGLIRDICFAVARFFSRIGRSNQYKVEIADRSTNLKPAESLICMFHGLKAHPSQFDSIRDSLHKDLENRVTYSQPFVNQAGNGKREEVIKPHLKEVEKWAKNNPDKPICLIGISNGVLISSEIAFALKEKGFTNPIKVFGIAGPIFGTKLMSEQGLWGWLLKSKCPFIGGHSADVAREMSWGSVAAKNLVERIREAAKKGVFFEFCATSDDSKVVPAASGFPKSVIGAQYHPFTRQGHSSIADAAIPIIQKSLKGFIAENQPKERTLHLPQNPMIPLESIDSYPELSIQADSAARISPHPTPELVFTMAPADKAPETTEEKMRSCWDCLKSAFCRVLNYASSLS